ncbi:hypothetical protein Tco_1143823 [Tanacetum coccineum]
MTTLAEHIIVAGAENRPPMLEKSMYDSWASRIRLFIKGKKHGRMMLDSIDNGPLVYPTVEENGQTRPKKYSELTEAQQLQDDCDVQATNIILHGLPPDVYALVNHQEAAKDIWDRVKMLMKGTELSYQERECRLYNLFDKFAHVPGETLYPDYLAFVANSPTLYNLSQSPQHSSYSMYPPPQQFTPVYAAPIHHQHHHTLGEDLIECINKAMAFLSAVASRPRNATWFKEKLMLAEAQEAGQILDEEQLAFLADPDDLDAYDSDCDDLSSAKAVLMANLSSCDHEVLSEVPYSDSYPNDMINHDVQEMQYYEQTHVDDFEDNEIHSGSNIIPYSQYLQETQDVIIQDTTPSTPNDLLVLSLVEQITDHAVHLEKENQTNKMVNESLIAELERYKERIAIFEQRLNVDLNQREKLIDSLKWMI